MSGTLSELELTEQRLLAEREEVRLRWYINKAGLIT
jgi:hypothetical protein